MADLPSPPTLIATIIIGITMCLIFIVIISFLIRYLKKRKESNLTLFTAMAFYFLAITSVFVGVMLQYLLQPAADDLQYSRYGFNIAYACSAMTNIFIVLLTSQIFSQAAIFRRTQKVIPIINAILNGVTVGLIIDALIADPQNPAYPLYSTVYHLVLTFLAYSILLGFSIRGRKNAMLLWEKAGFRFISFSALFGILIHLMLALDRVATLFIEFFADGYTIFSHLGWIFGIFMVSFAHLGFTMPQSIRNFYNKKENVKNVY